MEKIPFEDGVKVSNAKVTIDDVDYNVTPAQYSGTTPFSAYNLNQMQDNIESSLGGVLLWTNPKERYGVKETFDAQTVESEIEGVDFDTIEILFAGNIFEYRTNTFQSSKIHLIKEKIGSGIMIGIDRGNGVFTRNITISSDTIIETGKVYLTIDFAATQVVMADTTSNLNTRLIPKYIIGYKTGLFVGGAE